MSQLRDRSDKESVGTHGASARLLPVLPFLDLHPALLSAPWGDCSRVDQVRSSNLNTLSDKHC